MSATAARRAPVLPPLPDRWRGRLLKAVVALTAIGALYLLWLRDLPVVQVEEVTITGLTSHDAGRIRAALESEATEMTTLHVRPERLYEAIEGFTVVRGLDVTTDFPHGMRIHVFEHHPVALVASGRSRVPVGTDGGVLRGVSVKPGTLPLVKVGGALPADRVDHRATLDLLKVAGGAPRALAPRLGEVVRDGGKGIVVRMEEGPELLFGAPTRVRAKWIAATSVLADQGSQGASYVDLRMPDRPVAGGLAVDTIEPTDPALGYSQP